LEKNRDREKSGKRKIKLRMPLNSGTGLKAEKNPKDN
jgi:hypothetical protein